MKPDTNDLSACVQVKGKGLVEITVPDRCGTEVRVKMGAEEDEIKCSNPPLVFSYVVSALIEGRYGTRDGKFYIDYVPKKEN